MVRLQFMIAGSLAGMAEHIAMFPVDTIKTRMQAISTPGSQVGRPLTASKPVFSPRPTLFFFGSANGKWNRLLTTDFFFSLLLRSLLRFFVFCFCPVKVSSTILRAMSSVIRAEGIAGLYRGVAAVAIGAG